MGAFACSLVALLLAGSGSGTKYMETVLQDDAQFLHRPAAQVRESARQVAALGADRVRLTASWSTLAPAAGSRRVPGAPFDPRDSATYPETPFKKLDSAVKAAADAGLSVQIDLAFWAPRWAVRHRSSNPSRHRDYPNPDAFADFATAVARRYGGRFADPVRRSRPLPAVRMWTTWNEPNHPSFLAPQWVRDRKGAWRPMSPHVYRAMHNAAHDALKRVGPGNRVLVGGTASTGSPRPGRGGVPPLEFVRTMACVDRALRPLRVQECRDYKPVKADGWAHHPYSRYVTPGTSDPHPDDVPIADVSRLSRLLHELHDRGRLAVKLPLYHTEYAYETKQDDPFAPFTREQQAAFVGWSTYLAWRDPDTRMFAQFLLRDIDPRESGRRPRSRSYYRDWQSGLYTAAGEAKPAAQAFKLPFWAQVEGDGERRAVMLFGEVRPSDGPEIVRVEKLDAATGAWVPIRTAGPACDEHSNEFLTDHAGFFLRAAPAEGASSYRMAWQRDDGVWETGIPIPVAADPAAHPPIAG